MASLLWPPWFLGAYSVNVLFPNQSDRNAESRRPGTGGRVRGAAPRPLGKVLPSVMFSEVPPSRDPSCPEGASRHTEPRFPAPPLPSVFFLLQAEQGGEFCPRKTEMLNVANGIPGKCSVKPRQLFSFPRCFSQGLAGTRRESESGFLGKGQLCETSFPAQRPERGSARQPETKTQA